MQKLTLLWICHALRKALLLDIDVKRTNLIAVDHQVYSVRIVGAAPWVRDLGDQDLPFVAETAEGVLSPFALILRIVLVLD